MISIVELENLCNEIIDCPHSTPLWRDKGFFVVRNYNIKKGELDFSDASFVDEETYISRIKRGIPEEGDLVISREAPMGEVCIIPKNLKCCLGQRIVLLKVNRKICNPQFLVFAMLSDFVQKQISIVNKTGSIVSNLNISDLKKLLIPFLEKKKQDNIATVLSNISKKIKLNNQINSILERFAKSLYNYWFVQFDFPNARGKPYRASGGKMVYNDVLKREIPVGWEAKNLSDVIDCQTGVQPPKKEHISDYRKGYVRFIQNRDYDNQKKHLTFIPISTQNSICDRYDIMMDKYGDAGRIRYGISGAYNVALMKIIPKYEKMQEYLRNYFTSENIYNYLNGACKASTRASLNSTTFGSLKIVVPPNNLLKLFEKQAKIVLDNIIINREQNKQFTELRDFLLPLLMNGQVRVGGVHKEEYNEDC